MWSGATRYDSNEKGGGVDEDGVQGLGCLSKSVLCVHLLIEKVTI